MTRKVSRGDTPVVTKEVEVSKLVEPEFLTLTGKPANQVAFKVVRGDSDEDKPMTTETEQNRKRRVRSTKRSALLTIEMPEGATEEEAKATAEEYGLVGYEIATDETTGRLCVRRSDLQQTPTDAVRVTLAGGVVACVARSEAPEVQPSSLPAIALVAMEFSKEKFTDTDAAMEVIRRYDIDFLEDGVENTDNLIRVARSEQAEGEEVRRVEVEAGVVAVIKRAEVEDLGSTDASFIDVVSETAYGSWGWGHLDFAAALADVEFCNAADEATYRFRQVIDNILYYSELPVSVRKDLVVRASTQFSAYISSLIDGLPTKVVIINRSSEQKEQSMTKKIEDEKTPEGSTKRSDEQEATTETITRAEVQQMITDAVAAALAAAKPAEDVQRSDEGESTGETQEDSGEGKVLKAVETVTRSVEAISEGVKALADRLEKVEGATVVRSDAGDNATAATATKDVFAGVFRNQSK